MSSKKTTPSKTTPALRGKESGTTPPLRGTPPKEGKTTPALRATPPREGNEDRREGLNSPPSEGWQAKPAGVVPRLRFKEFKNVEPWAKRKLSEVLIEHGSKSTGNEEVFSVSVHKGVINQIEHLGRSFAAANTSHYNRVLPGDVIYTKSPTGDFPFGIIKQSKLDLPVIVSPLYGVFTPETNGLGCILDAFFDSPINVHNYLSPIIQKGAKNTINITNTTFLSRTLVLPVNKKEQTKIAECLTSLDEKITEENQKLEALKKHKRGLMQGLFPDHTVEKEETIPTTPALRATPPEEGNEERRGGLNSPPSEGWQAKPAGVVPRLRFKEFSGEWEEKILGKIATISAGGTPSTLNPKYWDGDIPWMNSGELNLKRVYSVANKITKLGLKESSTKLIPPGCVLIGLAGQGKTRGTAAINYIEICTNQSIAAIHPNEDEFNSEFLYHKMDSLYNYLRLLSKGEGGRGGLNLEIIKALEIFMPKLSEQTKIAECLTSLDELISAQTQKIEALKKHKKGMMQGLFPDHPGPMGHPSGGGE